MRKALLSLVATLLYFSAFTQITSIDSFYLPGTIWRNSSFMSHGGLQGEHWSNLFYYKVERDSVINGNNFHLLSGYDIDINQDYGIFGGIRVDNKKVYFTLFNYLPAGLEALTGSWQENVNDYFDVGVEKLIYDFGLEIGDAMPGKGFDSVVTNTDYAVLSTNVYAKGFYFGPIVPLEYWIEGVGSTRTLLHGTNYRPDKTLLCYDGVSTSYPEPMGYCYQSTTVKEIEKTGGVLIYPNPLTTENLTVENGLGEKIATIEIYDIRGKLQKTHTVHSKKEELEISVSPGVYFLKINYVDRSYIVQKLVRL